MQSLCTNWSFFHHASYKVRTGNQTSRYLEDAATPSLHVKSHLCPRVLIDSIEMCLLNPLKTDSSCRDTRICGRSSHVGNKTHGSGETSVRNPPCMDPSQGQMKHRFHHVSAISSSPGFTSMPALLPCRAASCPPHHRPLDMPPSPDRSADETIRRARAWLSSRGLAPSAAPSAAASAPREVGSKRAGVCAARGMSKKAGEKVCCAVLDESLNS